MESALSDFEAFTPGSEHTEGEDTAETVCSFSSSELVLALCRGKVHVCFCRMKNFQLSTSLRALLKELTCDCDSDDSAPCRMKAVSWPLTDLTFALQAALMKERVRNDRSVSVELVWTSQQEGFRIGSRPSPQCLAASH